MSAQRVHELEADSIPSVAALTTSTHPIDAAASALEDAIAATLERRSVARVAISGGSALQPWLRAELPWEQIHLTWVDERCVTHAESASNCGEARRGRSDRAAYELPLWMDDEDVPTAIARVQRGLAEHFDNGLDVTLLGMGGDGHIASLFVGHSWEGDRVVHIANSPKPPPRRMTLTHALLQTASTHVLFAVGSAKDDAVRRVLARDAALPASTLDGLEIVRERLP